MSATGVELGSLHGMGAGASGYSITHPHIRQRHLKGLSLLQAIGTQSGA